MLKFLSIATLVGAALVLSSADASASFFRKKKKGCAAPEAVAAPCCGGGAGYQAGGFPSGQYYTAAPTVGMPDLAGTQFVPTPMPAGNTVIVPSNFVQPAYGTTSVVPGSYTQPSYGSTSVIPTGYAVPTAAPATSGMRFFRR